MVQGGSTITQQLAKNLFLSPARTLRRKAQEMLLALWLEHNFSKDRILELYLNQVYLGAGTYGVDGAARRYFGRSVRDINPHQAALVAGLLKAPSRYAPSSDPAGARERADQVIANMQSAGYLSPAQAAAVRRLPLALAPPAGGRDARYFGDWVAEKLKGYVGSGHRDIVVRTTLDATLQKAAEKAVASVLDEAGERMNAHQAALVALSRGGAIRAMVGGRSYADSQFNRATQARRQPGSAFKLFVYLAALEAGLGPDTKMRDSPVILDGWQPRNYGGTYRGVVTLRQALARSINTVAVKLAERINRRRVIAVARRLGVTSRLTPHPSLALGSSDMRLIELTAAYGAVASSGLKLAPFGINSVTEDSGRTLYGRPAAGPGTRVLTSRIAAIMTDMLRTVIEDGTGRAARIGAPAAGKTGTSQDFRDAVFVGFSGDLVVGVWVGNDNGAAMKRVTGGNLPARIWQRFMSQAIRSGGQGGGGVEAAGRTAPAAEVKNKRKPGLWKRLFGGREKKPGKRP